MKIVTRADAGQWIKATNEYERIMAKAATQAMRDVGKLAVQKSRAAISAAGFSSRFARTMAAVNKPKTGYVLNPGVYVHSTINYADVFERGRTIVGDPYLWLPLPRVPGGHGRQHLTPKQYVAEIGPLVTMRRPGKPPMLGAVVEKGRRGRGRIRRRRITGTRQTSRLSEVVPMYVGVKQITIPKKFDTKAAMEDAFEQLEEFYAKRLEPYDGHPSTPGKE